jgi:hypothetical protein
MALDARKGALEAEASGEAKNLLQRFQGKEITSLQSQQSAAEAEKGAAAALLADKESGLPTEAQETLGKHIGDIAELQENLAKRQEAVLAGIMSNSDFRLQAEKLYYQVLAKSPGLKDEIAAAMSEYISFDPRGQTAKLRMDALNDTNAADAARAKADQKERDENRKILKDAALWNPDWSYEKNMDVHWSRAQSEDRLIRQTEVMQKAHAKGTLLTQADQEQMLTDFESGLRSGGSAQAKFSTIITDNEGNNINIASWTPSQVLATDSNTKASLLQAFELKRNKAIENFELWISKTQQAKGKETLQPYIDAINRDFETVSKILQGKNLSEIEGEMRKIKENRNAIVLADETNRLLLGYTDIQTLSALNNLIDADLMAQAMAFSTGTKVITDILLNKSEQLPPDSSSEIQELVGGTLKKVKDTYKRNVELSDPEVKASGNNLLALINTDLDGDTKHLNNKHLIAETLANEKYMEALERVDPKKHAKIMKRLIPTLKGVGEFTAGIVQREWQSKAEEFPEAAPTFNPKNYHLERSGGVLEVVPNTGVVDSLDADRVIDAQNSFNRNSRRLMKNMVSAYMNLEGASPKEAATWVSRQLGFSPKDITKLHSASPSFIPMATDFGEDVTSEPLSDDSTPEEKAAEDAAGMAAQEELRKELDHLKLNLSSGIRSGVPPSELLKILDDTSR